MNTKEFHSAELLSRPPRPIRYLVDGLLPLGGLADVSGPPGEGKSTIMLSAADHISRGAKWFGRAVQQMPVAWVSGEASGEDALQRDLHRLGAGEDCDILFLLPESEMFRFDKQSGWWTTTPEGAAVFQRCRDAGIGLVVLDTIGSLCAGLVEVDNDQGRQLARHIRKELAVTGMTCISVSHTNQASARDAVDWRLHYLSRAGGNGFPGAIRLAAGVSALRPEDAAALGGRVAANEICAARMVALGVSKHNEMPRPSWNNNSPAIFEIKQNGELVLVVDGEGVALHQRQGRQAKVKQESGVDKYGLRPLPPGFGGKNG